MCFFQIKLAGKYIQINIEKKKKRKEKLLHSYILINALIILFSSTGVHYRWRWDYARGCEDIQ
jgi:hypothetical protein